MSVATRQTEDHAVPTAASDSWRNWLMTGTRRGPIYRRRVRGANKGLKQMLVEGMAESGDKAHTWKRFSGAMVRQAVDEAVSSLPPGQKQLIKLAYFSDLTNREIAQGLGITLSSVERGLREAIARVSEYLERGRDAGRKAIYAIGLFLAGRHFVKAGVIIVAAATAGAVVSMQPAPPALLAPVERAGVPALSSAQPYAILQHHVVAAAQATSAAALHISSHSLSTGAVKVEIPAIDLPALKPPISITLPPLPIPPIHQGLLRA